MTTATHSPTTLAGPAEEPSGFGKLLAPAQAKLQQLDRFQQAHPRLAIPVAVFKKFGEDQAGNLAALVSHYAFFSLFPLLLVFATVLQYVLAGNPELMGKVLDSALTKFPVLGDQLRDIGTVKGSGIALGIGIVGALWGGLGAVEAMQNAMNSIWGVPFRARPNFLKSKLRSLAMVAFLGASIVATTVVTSSATIVESLPVVGRLVVIPLTLLLNTALFLGSFKILTEADVSWRELLHGAIAAGIAFSMLQVAGGWYVQHVLDGASAVYGTFAIVLGLLSWLHLQAQLTIVAAEINVVRKYELHPRSIYGPALTEGDRRALAMFAKIEERHPDEEVAVDLTAAPVEPEPRANVAPPAPDAQTPAESDAVLKS